MSWVVGFYRAGPTLFCLIAVVYLGYHVVNGRFGLRALQRTEAVERALSQELDQLRARRRALEARVALLRPEGIDPDMLDECVRAGLGLAHPDDLIILRAGRSVSQ